MISKRIVLILEELQPDSVVPQIRMLLVHFSVVMQTLSPAATLRESSRSICNCHLKPVILTPNSTTRADCADSVLTSNSQCSSQHGYKQWLNGNTCGGTNSCTCNVVYGNCCKENGMRFTAIRSWRDDEF